MSLHRSAVLSLSFFVATTALLFLAGCGAGMNSGNSVNAASSQRPTANLESAKHGMAAVPLDPGQLENDGSPANADANFQGCWYTHQGHRFQAVDVSVKNPGTYPFDAKLYYGTTCDPKTQADEFGFGQDIYFGGYGYILWFTAFNDRDDMSALWRVGTDTSKCVNYKVAADCP